ncbi:MAG TPA: thioesterase family protein [Sphingomicrobium sp.]|nr:thioesterase family protein [Sphingomicrobium sp.]
MSRDEPLGRDFYRVWRQIGTRWSDNDQYGHVNNTVFYQWFDTAVNGWLIDQGLLRLGESGRPIGLVAETACTFLRPLSYPATVEVGLAAARIGSASVTYRIGIFAQGSDSPAAEGRFVHVCVDPRSHRPVPMPAEWRSALERIAAPPQGAAARSA